MISVRRQGVTVCNRGHRRYDGVQGSTNPAFVAGVDLPYRNLKPKPPQDLNAGPTEDPGMEEARGSGLHF